MIRFTATERRSLLLGVALLALGTGARLALAPGRADFAWDASDASRPAESLSAAREEIGDTLEREREADRPLAPGETIDPNRADIVQLQRLPGVGPARAAAIVRERETNGPFGSPGDLTRVPGVGDGLVRRWAAALAPSASVAPRPRGGASRIDLNRALPKELEQITGIGPALARRIVDARSSRGRFGSIEELLEIPGIGPKTLDRLRQRGFVQ
ncbi:MAG: ComEA family DNA-binding protein [Gemmatimonadota bacterium]